MKALKEILSSRASNWALLLLSGSLFAVAVSNWTRPEPASAQGESAPRVRMSSDSRQVLGSLENAFVNLAEGVEPAVVTISARSTPAAQPERRRQMGPMNPPDEQVPDFFREFFRRFPRGEQSPAPSGGSGLIVRENGGTAYVLTNNHVVEKRDRLRITTHDGNEYAAELLGVDEKSDLAVLKFKTRKPLSAGGVAKLGNSDLVKVGQWAAAIGSPLGYDSTFTVGVISARGRDLPRLGEGFASYTDLIQTDASINPGNSGGPLVNIDGEVIGINVAIAAPGGFGSIGIGFAIPSNVARMVADQLIEKGKVIRGYLGVGLQGSDRRVLAAELRELLKVPAGGALCETVAPGTPAARAGVKEGDVIVKFGERSISNFSDLEKAVAATRPGTAMPVEIVRDGRPVRLNITVVERPAERELVQTEPGGAQPQGRPGQPAETSTRLGLVVKQGEGGVEITRVEPGSAAEEAGIQSGDVVTAVGRVQTPTVEAFQKALDNSPRQGGVVLRVRTPTGMRFVVVRP